jgi:hypothetical protein
MKKCVRISQNKYSIVGRVKESILAVCKSWNIVIMYMYIMVRQSVGYHQINKVTPS